MSNNFRFSASVPVAATALLRCQTDFGTGRGAWARTPPCGHFLPWHVGLPHHLHSRLLRHCFPRLQWAPPLTLPNILYQDEDWNYKPRFKCQPQSLLTHNNIPMYIWRSSQISQICKSFAHWHWHLSRLSLIVKHPSSGGAGWKILNSIAEKWHLSADEGNGTSRCLQLVGSDSC